MRFNQLPEKSVIDFLDNINVSENLKMSRETILNIKKYYNSDIRSMINYMQNNVNNNKIETITDTLLQKIFTTHTSKSFTQFNDIINKNSKSLLIDSRILIRKYINFLIVHKQDLILSKNIKNDIQFLYNNTNTSKSLNYLFYLLSNK